MVTAANATGPFTGEVDVLPESPAKGKLYSNILGTIQGGPTEQQDITIIGDASGIEIGDQLLVFRDADGTYYSMAPNAAPGSNAFVATLTGSKSGTVGSRRYVATRDDTLADVSVRVVNIDDNATLPSGMKVIVHEVSGAYYTQVPLWL